MQGKIALAFDLVYNYIKASLIMLFHPNTYDKKYFESSKYATGGKLGKWTAPIWKWIVDDYKQCKKCHKNEDVPWPCSPDIRVVSPENIDFHPDDLNNFQSFGIYYQGNGKITIGKGTFIGPNVGLITANHNPDNLSEHLDAKPILLGKNCWIGMNSIILPGVELGDNTVVGAGSVVTKSFLEGNCVVAGNPAKKIKDR